MKIIFTLLTSTLSLIVCKDFELTVLHTNDVHSHVEQFNKYGGSCSENEPNKCFGGAARRHTVIEQIRNSTKNVILLDGGDQFSGTLWFSEYKGMASVRFMNYTGYDAMAIGNHEFDNGPEGLINFLKKANFSVLSSNMDVSKELTWPKPDTLFKRSVVLERSGKKIGVIGYTTQETTWLSRPGENIKFTDEVIAIRKEATKLKGQGINILIAVGHSGYKKDQEIAREVNGLDIVVGGHTNTFLYNGAQPSNDKIQGPYPLVITRQDESKCLVVQDFTYGKYLGHLKVIFNENGILKSWNGNPIMLNATYEQDEKVLEMVKQMSGPIVEARNKSVGRTLVFLQGSKEICRTQECNLGNLITDAIVKEAQKYLDNINWASVGLGIWNGGGIRSGNIDKKFDEWITLEELGNILPFGNTADIITIKGKYLLQAFENGFSAPGEGRFPQVSGFKIQYDSSKPVGNRVVEVLALCVDCRVPEYKKIEEEKLYKVVASNYLSEGGDNYTSLKKYTEKHPGKDALVDLSQYFKNESPVAPALEGRIVDISKIAKRDCLIGSGSTVHSLGLFSFILCFIFYVFIVYL